MFPPAFDYHRAESVDEAIDLLAEHADDDPRLLAGGHGLVPELKDRSAVPGVLIDIGGIDSLRYIDGPDRDDENGRVRVGALTTYATIATSDTLWESGTAFAESVHHVGDVQIRNRGTIGGNIAQADPAADPPAGVLASKTTIETFGPAGHREIDATEFFRGNGDTALQEHELITAVTFPRLAETGGAYVKKAHPASGYAMVGVAATVAVSDGMVTDCLVAINGVADPPRRLPDVEAAVVEEPASRATAETGGDAVDAGEEPLLSDSYASGEYRASVLPTYVREALDTAIGRATGEIPSEPDIGPTAQTHGGGAQ